VKTCLLAYKISNNILTLLLKKTPHPDKEEVVMRYVTQSQDSFDVC
jgi:hypothetical protein